MADAALMTNPKLPAFIRRDVERAIEAALRPKGMSTHDGKARIGVDRLQYMLQVIDAEPDEAHPCGCPSNTAGAPVCEERAGNGFSSYCRAETPRSQCPDCKTMVPDGLDHLCTNGRGRVPPLKARSAHEPKAPHRGDDIDPKLAQMAWYHIVQQTYLQPEPTVSEAVREVYRLCEIEKWPSEKVE